MSITLKELARITGTSVTAVSFVLNDKGEQYVSEENRQKIKAAIKKYGYRQNKTALGLRVNRSFQVSLCMSRVISELSVVGNFSSFEIISRISGALHDKGYAVRLLQFEEHNSPQEIIDKLKDESSDAFIFMQWAKGMTNAIVPMIKELGAPCFFLDPQQAKKGDAAIVDRGEAITRSVDILYEKGRREIALLNNDVHSNDNTKIKVEAYQHALKSKGLKALPIIEVSDFTLAAYRESVAELLDKVHSLDGLILTDNYQAALILNLLGERDLDIIGFGDAVLANACDERFSVMALPIKAIVEDCVTRLVKMIESSKQADGEQRVFACDFITKP